MGNRAHKLPFLFFAATSYISCRVPSLIFISRFPAITRWMTDTSKYEKITDYQTKYLDVSKGIIDVLEKNDRQMEPARYDIKPKRY